MTNLLQFQDIDVTGDYMDLLSHKLRQAVKDGHAAEADKLMRELAAARERWVVAQRALFK